MTLITRQLSKPGGPAIAYREAGRAHVECSETVVLLHGVGMQSAAWTPQIDVLSRTFHVIALDLPGHGESAPLSRGSDLTVFVDWLGSALDALEQERVSLVGHSMGALIASGFSIARPDRVARVALLNGVFQRDAAARKAVIARAFQIAEGAFDVETPLARWFTDDPIDQKARDQVEYWLRTVDSGGYETAYRAFAQGDQIYAERFGEIACPLLAMTGEMDPNSTPAMAQAMARAAQDGEANVVAGHRHMLNLTAPDIVNGTLMAWLTRTTSKELIE